MAAPSRVKHISGRAEITDEKIRELVRKGWFNNQIRTHYKVSMKRIKKVVREDQSVDFDCRGRRCIGERCSKFKTCFA